MWNVVDFGKWKGKGKTLPQILVADPDWFFWALDNGAFKGPLAVQAETLAHRARAIRLPPALAGTHCVRHWLSFDGKYYGFELIEATQGPHHGSSSEARFPFLNMEFPRKVQQYVKVGGKHMMKSFKQHWFGGRPFTKAKVEAFFSDPANFDVV